jgi:hypothetical protein
MRPSLVVSLLVCALVAGPSLAATKRAVQPLGMIPFTYTLYDATTGHPVVGAEVRSGTQLAISDVHGSFTIPILNGRPTLVIVHRTGYDDLMFSVTLSQGGSIPVSFPLPGGTPPIITYPNAPPPVSQPTPQPAPAPPTTPTNAIPLQPRATVSVQLTSGQTTHLDADSVQFAYVLPFATPEGSNSASFCKSDGSAWTPDRAEFAQIAGPATSTTNSTCCKLGPLLAVDVKMKSGESARVTFADSCFGYDIDFVGRDHESAQYVYFNFKDIALIVFP